MHVKCSDLALGIFTKLPFTEDTFVQWHSKLYIPLCFAFYLCPILFFGMSYIFGILCCHNVNYVSIFLICRITTLPIMLIDWTFQFTVEIMHHNSNYISMVKGLLWGRAGRWLHFTVLGRIIDMCGHTRFHWWNQ